MKKMKKSIDTFDKFLIFFTILFVIVGIALMIYTFLLNDESYIIDADLICNENYRIIVSKDGHEIKRNIRYAIDGKIYINQQYIKELTNEKLVDYEEYDNLELRHAIPLALYLLVLLLSIMVGNIVLYQNKDKK